MKQDLFQEYFDYEPDESCGGTCADLEAPAAPPDYYYVQLAHTDRVQHLLNRRSEGEYFAMRMVVVFFLSGIFFLAVDLNKQTSGSTRIAAYAMCCSLAAMSILGFFLVHVLWLRPVQRDLDKLRDEHLSRKTDSPRS